jgi:aminobenzoyl-glutamate utilization protein B
MDDIAAGAAMMTGTKVEKKVLTGCNETRIVPALVELMNDVMVREVPAIRWTAEEEEFSRQLLESQGADWNALAATFGADVKEKPLDSAVACPTGKTIDILGSSDLSDVSYVTPTCMLFAATYPKGTPNHTWGVTACSGNSIGQKGMVYAAQVMAQTGYRLVTDPELLKDVRASYERALGGAVYAPVG